MIDLANMGLEYINMPIKKAKEAFSKVKDKELYEKYISMMLFPLMQNSTKP